MNETPCDRMMLSARPYCYLGRLMRIGCTGCSYYLQDQSGTQERAEIWRQVRAGEIKAYDGTGHMAP
jgi:hypothetical protein